MVTSKYIGLAVKAKPGLYQGEAYENDGVHFGNLTVSDSKYKDIGRGCDKTLFFQFHGQNDINHWYPAKHFIRI